jgi:hypothetical protein
LADDQQAEHGASRNEIAKTHKGLPIKFHGLSHPNRPKDIAHPAPL